MTNAHVAETCPVVRTAGPPEKRVFVRQWGEDGGWYRHPEGDDVVVTPIGFAPKDARDFYLDYVPRDWFVTPENFIHASHDVTAIPAARFLDIDWGNLDRVGHNDYAIDWAESDAASSFPRRF